MLPIWIIFIIFFFIFIVNWPVFIKNIPNCKKWKNGETNNPKEFRKLLNENGTMMIPNYFTEEETDNIYHKIGSVFVEEYGSVNNPYHRMDEILPLSNMKSSINALYNKDSQFWNSVFPNYTISECSILTSYPGANSQPWHSDTTYKYDSEAELVSIGIALDDIEEDMGPLEVIPRSNTYYDLNKDTSDSESDDEGDDEGVKYNAQDFFDVKDEECINWTDWVLDIKYMRDGLFPEKCVCKKGSLVFWSSKVIHRGSANNSNKKRPVFYISLLEPDKQRPHGATYSLSKNDDELKKTLPL